MHILLYRWRRLFALAEERHKLLTAAITYYKMLQQILPLLDNLEMDYQKTRDWCARWKTDTNIDGKDKMTFMADELGKHMDHKARFLRVR